MISQGASEAEIRGLVYSRAAFGKTVSLRATHQVRTYRRHHSYFVRRNVSTHVCSRMLQKLNMCPR